MDTGFLKWIEHAGFMIEMEGKRLYIDPFRIRGDMPKADIIFITHSHFDHLNEDALAKVATGETRFVAPKETAGKLSGRKVMPVEPGKEYEIEGIRFSTVPAYNISKEFHPRANGWVGYVLDINGTKVYHPGDTDATEEMRRVDADIFMMPVGGHYTMDLQDAIKIADVVRAQAFVPIHYRALLGEEGSRKAEEEFKQRVKNAVILEQIQEPYYSLQ